MHPDAAGIIHSRVFPGCCLAVTALLDGDLAGVFWSLYNKGLANAEHQAFVETLAAAMRPKLSARKVSAGDATSRHARRDPTDRRDAVCTTDWDVDHAGDLAVSRRGPGAMRRSARGRVSHL